MDYLMGIDLGSTNLKAVIYNLDGWVMASGSRPTEQFHPNPEHPDWTVWRPDQIWQGTAEAVKEAVSQIDNPRQIRAVAVTGMGQDGLPVDEKGQWLYPFISWLDPRTQPQLEWWQAHIGADKVFAIGGNPLWRFSTALRILWMAEHEPEILARTDKWLLIEDYLNFKLCGRRATDYTMASTTLLFDQRRLDWSNEVLELAGIDRRLMCDPYPSGTVLGEVNPEAAEATGLPAGTPLVLGGHDYLCGALPVGAFEPGTYLDINGTWEIVTATIPEPVLTPEAQNMGLTVEAHIARDRYAASAAAVASAMLEWYRQEFGFEAKYMAEQEARTDWEVLVAGAAAAPPGAKGVLFLPHMSSAGCPDVDTRSLGAFVGLSNTVTHADMLRAMIEGLNYQLLDIIKAMESCLAVSAEKLIAVGGATRNTFWMQNKADILDRPIEVPAVEEATSLGAAIIAGIGVGLYDDEREAFERVKRIGRLYEPDQKLSDKYAGWFQIYKQLYPALKSVHHQLHEQFLA